MIRLPATTDVAPSCRLRYNTPSTNSFYPAGALVTDEPDESEDDSSHNPRCPVCGRPSLDDPCPHLVSSWSFAEDSGEWAATPHPQRLRGAVEGLLAALDAGFTERQLEVIAELLSLPPEVLPLLAESVREGDFSGGGWDDYLRRVAEAGSTYAGSGECETDTPGACSGWTNHWATDRRAWARSVGAGARAGGPSAPGGDEGGGVSEPRDRPMDAAASYAAGWDYVCTDPEEPLPTDVANELRDHLATRPAGGPVWPGTWAGKAADLIRVDLPAAGLPFAKPGPDGRALVVSFYSLRHSVGLLAEAGGATLREVMTLMRHSDPKLPLKTYDRLQLDHLSRTVANMPSSLPAGGKSLGPACPGLDQNWANG